MNNDFLSIKMALSSLSDRIQKNVMMGATRASARVVQKEAKRIVRVKTGNLKLSVLIQKEKIRQDGVVRYTVRTGRKKHDGYYGRFLEFGTVNMAPKPFLRPAYEAKKDELIDAFREYASKRIDKEIEKAKR
ncbi:MAG: HK97 gp10 family phage protein [Epsilonproteobacteria bacterium]|nr:HK97 gp10 family phage protein [Campylobacterota bacterium]